MHSNYPRAVHVTSILTLRKSKSSALISRMQELVIYLIDEKQMIAVNIDQKC